MRKTIFVGWRQVAVSMLNQAVASGTIIVCFSVIAVPLQKEFAPSRTVLMLIMTITYLINGLANPVLGAAMDRYSIRKILMGGGVFLAAGYFALSLSTSMVQVFLAYGVFLSLANATLGPLSYSTLLPRWFVRRRARAVGITVLGYALGGLLLPPIFQFLIDTFGWRDAVRLFAAFVVVFVIPVIGWLVVDWPSDVGLYPDGDTQPPPAAVGESTYQQESTMLLLRDMNFWVITLAVGLVVCGAAGVLGNMVPFVISRIHRRKGCLGLVLFLCGQFQQQTSVCGLRRSFESPRWARGRSIPLYALLFLLSTFPHLSCSAHRQFSARNGGRRGIAALELFDSAHVRFS